MFLFSYKSGEGRLGPTGEGGEDEAKEEIDKMKTDLSCVLYLNDWVQDEPQ